MFKITSSLFDSKWCESETIGLFTKEEKDSFVKALLKLGYQRQNIDDDADNGEEQYGVRLPQPAYEHHGDYYKTYCISEYHPPERGIIQDAIDRILNPAMWDVDESYDATLDWDFD